MKKITFLVVLVMLVAAPMSIMAMSHGKDSHGGHDMKEEKSSDMDHGSMKSMDHGKMKSMDHGKMDHDSMMAEGGMMMLGTEVKEGVKARVHIKDVSEAMAKMGMDHTHHLMVNFTSEKNGAAIEKGTVAVKVISPDETEAKPVKMMGMEGHFGADLVLDQKGLYHFYIGTKLEDGTKRQYHFHTDVK